MGGEWDGVVGLGTMGDFAKGGRDAVTGVESPRPRCVCACVAYACPVGAGG